jgi:hypothetical protein
MKAATLLFKLALTHQSVMAFVVQVNSIIWRAKQAAGLTPEMSTQLGVVEAMSGQLEGTVNRIIHLERQLTTLRAAEKSQAAALRHEATKYGHMAVVAADNDVAKAQAFGMEQAASKAPKVTELLAPAGLHITPFANGKVVVECDAVKGASRYLLERSFDPPTDSSWSTVTGGTSRRRTVKGLPPGQKMWFRMAAVTASGQSPWSAPQLVTIS